MAGGGKGGSQEVIQTQKLDPKSQAFLDQARRAATGVWQQGQTAGSFIPGINAMTQQGQQALGQQYNALGGLGTTYGQMGGNVQTGLDILNNAAQGNVSQFMNPYEAQVVGGVQADFDRQRGLANAATADQATRAGAFGGSRSAVLQANALNDVNRNETGTLANIRQQGFESAMNNALGIGSQLTNYGLAGLGGQRDILGAQNQIAGQQMAAGEYNRALRERQLGEKYYRGMEGLGAFTPFLGGNVTTMGPAMGSNPLMSGLGGAATGFGIGGPIGAGIGGGIGLLGGLFGL